MHVMVHLHDPVTKGFRLPSLSDKKPPTTELQIRVNYLIRITLTFIE